MPAMLCCMNKGIVVAGVCGMVVALGGCSRSSEIATTTTSVTTTSAARTSTPGDEYQAARTAAQDWIAHNPDQWVLRLNRDNPLFRPAWSKPCSENPDSRSVTLRYGAGGQEAGKTTEIDLAFRCPIGTGVAVGDLAGAFADAVLQHLPHGIVAPNWTFDILTPRSSFAEGVAFKQPAVGRLLVTIETPMFAVYGHSTRPECKPPADASSPPGCYLQLEHRIPLRLSLTAPFTGAELG
jgi:hypothetical protein